MFCNKKGVIPIFMVAMIICMAVHICPLKCHAQPPAVTPDDNSKYVSIDFNDVDLNVFIKFISKITGKNFVVDSGVKGNVTIISPTKISIEEAYKVFESVLEINGFSSVASGKIIKIISTPAAKSDNIDTRIATGPARAGTLDDKIVTRLVPLEYASAEELKKLFTPLVSKGSVVLSYNDTNMLILTATLSSIDRLLKIIEAIDVQSIGKKITVMPVKYADATKLVKNLSFIFTARVKEKKGQQNTGLGVIFVADERTNSIIVLASNVETQRVTDLIEVLDQKMPKGEEKIRVYYLEHASAENLVKVLTEIPSNVSKSTTEGKKKTPLLSTDIKIMADTTTNSLIIMADKEDYPVLEEVISKLDIPRAMVYIEALIMEVNITRGLDIGTEWKVGSSYNNSSGAVIGGYGGTGDSGFSNLGSLSSDGTYPMGFSVGILGDSFSIGGVTFPNIQAVVNAFQSDKDVHILSTPQILTTENEEASITIGKNVPYQTKSAAESSSETYSSYEYKDVGITLKITPQISKGRLVRLDVYQEITKLDTVNQNSPDRPTTFKREIKTTIIVEDNHSVVIGGLIDESVTQAESRTPCLGDVPGLGWVFKTLSEGKELTNLYIFLTPRVIKNPLESDKIFKEKKEDIDIMIKGEVTLYDKLNKKDDVQKPSKEEMKLETPE